MTFELTAQEPTTGPGIARGRLVAQIHRLLASEARYSLRRFKDDQPTRDAYDTVRTERLRLEAKLAGFDTFTPEEQEALF